MWNMNVYKIEVFWTTQDIIVFIRPFLVRPRIINCKWEGMPTEKKMPEEKVQLKQEIL